MYHKKSPENWTDSIRVTAGQTIDYVDMSDYIRAWPDKLVSFVAEHLCDDDMNAFVRALYEYICQEDAEGPAFEEWRAS